MGGQAYNVKCDKTKVRGILLLIPLVNTLFLVSSYSLASGASQLIVPDHFETIQAAIDAAEEGSSIWVRPGKYFERLVISKSLNLLGTKGSTIIIGDDKGDTVKIPRGVVNVTFSGFVVKGSGTSPWAGVHIRGLNNTIKDIAVTDHFRGIYMWDSSYNTLRNCNLTGNRYNLEIWGLPLKHFVHNIDTSNIVNGKPVYYLFNQRNRKVPLDAGYVAIINSSYITLENLNLQHNGQGLLLAYTNNSLIRSVNFSNNLRGIHVIASFNNTLAWNDVSWNVESGVFLISSSTNTVLGNNLTNNRQGISISSSLVLQLPANENMISDNRVTDNYVGLSLSRESVPVNGNRIIRNTIMRNEYGVRIGGCSDNFLYHNNFIDNMVHIVMEDSLWSQNIWDNSYPSGGNYWSNYSGADVKSGPNQDLPGGDGIGDEPYIIDNNNQDRYPLVNPLNPPIADFTFEPSSPKVSEQVSFLDGSSDPDGSVVSWVWVLDGRTYLGKNISYCFMKSGNYSVTLTVYDDRGMINMVSKVVVVSKIISNLTLCFQSETIVGKRITLSGILLDEKWNPISEAMIDFYLSHDEFSEWIGSANTNLSGVATINYKPLNSGILLVQAIYKGNEMYASASATQQLIINEDYSYATLIFVVATVSIGALVGILSWKRLRKRRV